MRLIVDAKSEAAAAEVEKHVTAAIDKGKRESEQDKSATKHDQLMRTLADEWYQSRKVHRQGARIEWLGYSSVRIADLFETGLGDVQNTSPETKQPMP